MPKLHVQLLGDLHLSYDDAALKAINAPRLQSLLAYLLLHRDAPESRQRLAFQFWPDTTEAQARANLRFFLHRLRRALPDSDRFLYTDEAVVQWRATAPFTLDVAEFENALTNAERRVEAERSSELEKAVTLYRGDLLASCYDDWILPERERLHQLVVGALEQLLTLLETRGDSRAAITYGERLLRYDPLHEETYRRLMRLRASSGDRVGALRVYHTCVAVLAHELDVEPSAATRAEYEQLLSQVTRAPSEANYAPLQLPNAPPNNLPMQLTSFVGRAREMREVKRLLKDEGGQTTEEKREGGFPPLPPSLRLVTLTGAGGSGKTRLALEVAADLLLARAFPDGIWWVELAALTDPALVTTALAAALGVREQRDKSLLEMLSDYLKPKRVLLVLDNCEHLIGACASMTEALLRACPVLRILATSREPLKSAGEIVWLVPPLTLPETGLRGAEILASARQSEAVRLFSERAAFALPTFALTRENAPAVSEICRRLDGLPLALELAAARVKVLQPEQIAARLDDRFKLLTAGARTALPRHQSLRAVMDWSYELLSEPERLLFQRLSVFAGGFTLEAAEAVCQGRDLEAQNILELLAFLGDKSLVVVEARPFETRYRLLDTVRQYAREKLIKSDGVRSCQTQHARFFLTLADQAKPKLQGIEQQTWLDRLGLEHDNLRGALGWSLENAPEIALRLVDALWLFWFMRGYFNEGRRWAEAALESTKQVPATESEETHPARGGALYTAASFALNQGDFEPASALSEESLAWCRTHGDDFGQVISLHNLGAVARRRGDYQKSEALFRAGLELSQKTVASWLMSLLLNDLGNVFHEEGDLQRARSLYEESLALSRGRGDKWLSAIALVNLADVAFRHGEYERATRLTEEALTAARELKEPRTVAYSLFGLGEIAQRQGNYMQAVLHFKQSLALFKDLDHKGDMIECLEGLARASVGEGYFEQAVRLLGAAEASREFIHTPLPPMERAEYERTVAAVRAQLDEATCARVWKEGRMLTMEQAIQYGLEAPSG